MKLSLPTPPSRQPSPTPPSPQPGPSSAPQLAPLDPPARPGLKLPSLTAGLASLSLAIPAKEPSHYGTSLNGPDSDDEADPKWGVGDQERMAGELMDAIRGPAASLEDELSGATRRVRSSSRVGGPRPMLPTAPVPGASSLYIPCVAALSVQPDAPVPEPEEEELESAVEEELDIRPETLEDLGRLGEGASGEVRKVRHRPTGTVMAQKVRLILVGEPLWGKGSSRKNTSRRSRRHQTRKCTSSISASSSSCANASTQTSFSTTAASSTM